MGTIDNERICVPQLTQSKKRVQLTAEKKIQVAELRNDSNVSNKEWRLYISIKKNDLFIGLGGLNWIVRTTVDVDGCEFYITAVPGWEGGEIEGQDIVEFYAYGSGKPKPVYIPTKFYYPRNDELHIGWEGQINWNVGYEHSFSDIIVSQENLMDFMFYEGCTEIRCPLLTREQIEKEDWVYISNINPGIFRLGGTWEIWWYFNERTIEIHGFNRLHYRGSCPTINHLRDIMKLLNIK